MSDITHRSAQSERAKELAGLILAKLDDRARDIEGWMQQTAQALSESQAFNMDLGALGQARQGLSAAHAPFRAALSRCTAITHDIEIVRRMSRVLEESDIDLTDIFDERFINHGLGNQITVKQDGDAVVRYDHTDSCLVTEYGHATIDVPLKIEDFGHAYKARVNASIGLSQPPERGERVFKTVTRGPHFCPAGDMPKEFQALVSEDVSDKVKTYEGPISMPQLPDFGLGDVDYYAPMFSDLVRVHGSVRKRSRTPSPAVASLPDWADTGIKIVPELIIAGVQSQISRNGLTINGGPWYRGKNAFDIAASMHFSYRDKIGCITYGADVYGDVVIRTQARIEHRNILILDTWDISNNVRVDLKPSLGWLNDWLERRMEDMLASRIPRIRHKKTIPLLSARRAEVDVSAERFMVYMQTRRLFGG
ncbi:hypothetical protein ACFL12_01225 [Pseudomonadota bacterium]